MRLFEACRRMSEGRCSPVCYDSSHSASVCGRQAYEWREMSACLLKQFLRVPLFVAGCAMCMNERCLPVCRNSFYGSASACERRAHEWSFLQCISSWQAGALVKLDSFLQCISLWQAGAWVKRYVCLSAGTVSYCVYLCGRLHGA